MNGSIKTKEKCYKKCKTYIGITTTSIFFTSQSVFPWFSSSNKNSVFILLLLFLMFFSFVIVTAHLSQNFHD